MVKFVDQLLAMSGGHWAMKCVMSSSFSLHTVLAASDRTLLDFTQPGLG